MKKNNHKNKVCESTSEIVNEKKSLFKKRLFFCFQLISILLFILIHIFFQRIIPPYFIYEGTTFTHFIFHIICCLLVIGVAIKYSFKKALFYIVLCFLIISFWGISFFVGLKVDPEVIYHKNPFSSILYIIACLFVVGTAIKYSLQKAFYVVLSFVIIGFWFIPIYDWNKYEIEKFITYNFTSCPEELPLKDIDGNCFPCNETNEIKVYHKVKNICPNREIQDCGGCGGTYSVIIGDWSSCHYIFCRVRTFPLINYICTIFFYIIAWILFLLALRQNISKIWKGIGIILIVTIVLTFIFSCLISFL